MTHAIEARAVTKLYAADLGIRDLNLKVPPGTILGMIGPSGSGKTTTVRLLTGLLRRDAGELSVLGIDPDHFDGAARSRIGYLAQDSLLYPTLSLSENLDFVGALYGMTPRERRPAIARLLEFVELDDAADRRLVEASGGMKRRLGLAAALVHDPEVAFLDEPTAGLDPILRKTIWDQLDALRDQGRTVVVTTQYVGEAAHCDEVAVLSDGRIIEQGAPEELRRAAYGGELVDVVFSTHPTWGEIDAFREAVGASEVTRMGPGSVRLTVEDAGSAIPRISEVATTLGLDIAETERYLPEFDDVFVRLVDRMRTAA